MLFVYIGLGVLALGMALAFMTELIRDDVSDTSVVICLIGIVIALSAWVSTWGGPEETGPNKIDTCNSEGKIWYEENAGKSTRQAAQCLTKEQVDILND